MFLKNKKQYIYNENNYGNNIRNFKGDITFLGDLSLFNIGTRVKIESELLGYMENCNPQLDDIKFYDWVNYNQ